MTVIQKETSPVDRKAQRTRGIMRPRRDAGPIRYPKVVLMPESLIVIHFREVGDGNVKKRMNPSRFLFMMILLVALIAPSGLAMAETGNVAALAVASRTGDLATVKELIEGGSPVNGEDENRFTPLFYAAANNHIEVTAYLLGKGADPNAHSSESGTTALLLASQMGHPGIVKLLLDKGAQINATDNLGMTPLIRAAYSCKEDVVEILLNRGADVRWKDTLDETALIVAERKYNKFVMLDEGRNIDRKNYRGRYEKIIDLLKHHGAQ